MLITDRHDTAGRDLVDVVRAAVDGGVDCVQVREKDLGHDELLDLTNQVIEAVGTRARVVVNGNAPVAREAGAGLHLPEDAQQPLGWAPQLWGRSVHSVDGALRAMDDGPDYLLLGTIYKTSSKPGLEGSGIELVRSVVQAVGALPVLAIGGINAANAAAVMGAGASGIAVRSAILHAEDPSRAASEIKRVLADLYT